jgi:hypothetical protein
VSNFLGAYQNILGFVIGTAAFEDEYAKSQSSSAKRISVWLGLRYFNYLGIEVLTTCKVKLLFKFSEINPNKQLLGEIFEY